MAFDPNKPHFRGPMEHEKLSLYVPPAKPGQRMPKLSWSVNFGHPRITVYTNDPSIEDKEHNFGRIQARLDIPTFQSFLELLDSCTLSLGQAKDPEAHGPVKYVVKNMRPWVDSKRVENPEVINEIFVGRDKEGTVWMSVIEENKPKIKFEFKLSDWHGLYNGQGEPFTTAQMSSIVARSYVRMLRALFPQSLFMEEHQEILNMPYEERKNMFNTDSNTKAPRKDSSKAAPSTSSASSEPSNDFADDLPF